MLVTIGFNKNALIGGTTTVNCPFVADKTACTPPAHEPFGVIAAPPSVKPPVLFSADPFSSGSRSEAKAGL